MKELRPYQQKLIDRTIGTDKDVIICLPTGGGKTFIAHGIMDRLDCKVLFVVPRLELVKQAKEEFGDVDILWSNKTSLEGKRCIIASKDTLRIRYNKLSDELKEEIRNGVLILDEVHISLEQSYKLVKMLQPKRVIGLTATPERMDGLALLKGNDSIHKYGIFDEVIQEETIPSLIKKEYLTKLKYYTKPIEGITDIKPDNALAEELSGNQMMKIFSDNNVWGDLVSSYEEFGKGRPALGFANTIAMAEQVARVFNEAGYRFSVIHGEMSVNERQELIDALRNHNIDGLVNASLLTYGFDCPPVSYAFNCRHIKSRPLWFQIVGRILRPYEGKEDAVFVDHADSISEFSEPDCSLPILDETISWRVNGENKEQRRIRKESMKKVRDTMKQIQEWDPLPAQLVEVTMENTWERLLRIIKRLKKENADLMDATKSLRWQMEKAQMSYQLVSENLQKVQMKAREIANENSFIKEEKQRLEEENRFMKESGTIVRYADDQKTFAHIKSRYIRYRLDVENEHPGISREDAHRLVQQRFLGEEDNLPFLYDEYQFKKGMTYWFNNYEARLSSSNS